jgi:hypothetical protein
MMSVTVTVAGWPQYWQFIGIGQPPSGECRMTNDPLMTRQAIPNAEARMPNRPIGVPSSLALRPSSVV